ncbi:MAG: hypothetical protein HQK96_03265 [Nitrospirae bacterium]|nr:hypothetical protein [Nitrospirota bacterium]
MSKVARGVLIITAIAVVLIVSLSAISARSGKIGPEDVRNENISATILDLSKLRTLIYDETTTFALPNRPMAEKVLREGMNPGLGIRQIHKQGITGKGVNVAIIDQNLAQDFAHPEYAGKILRYADMGIRQLSPSRGSFHGPAVTSLLVGTQIGTAPDARVFYASTNVDVSDPKSIDAKHYADALEWIIAQNRLLPAGQKIRVVSVSAAPSGAGSPFTKNQAMWDVAVSHARQEGILVLDCTEQNGITLRMLYDYDNPDDAAKITPIGASPNRIFAPVNRTIAKEYENGKFSYIYSGKGGLSWTIPYVAGVLAMGWQLRPDLTGDQMVELLLESAFEKDGNKIINPAEFIKRVQSPSAATVKAYRWNSKAIPDVPAGKAVSPDSTPIPDTGTRPEVEQDNMPGSSGVTLTMIPPRTTPTPTAPPRSTPGVGEGKRIEDKTDLPFVDDPVVVGQWTSVDYVPDPGVFKPETRSWNGDLFLKGLTFQAGGSTDTVWKWTKGVVIDEHSKTASKYEIRIIGDKQYMFLEWKSGDYTIRHMKPKYYVLMRQPLAQK